MSLQLFGHPVSSYTMKALIALYENQTPFEFQMLGPDHPANGAELARRWPVAKFPLLVDGETTCSKPARSSNISPRSTPDRCR